MKCTHVVKVLMWWNVRMRCNRGMRGNVHMWCYIRKWLNVTTSCEILRWPAVCIIRIMNMCKRKGWGMQVNACPTSSQSVRVGSVATDAGCVLLYLGCSSLYPCLSVCAFVSTCTYACVCVCVSRDFRSGLMIRRCRHWFEFRIRLRLLLWRPCIRRRKTTHKHTYRYISHVYIYIYVRNIVYLYIQYYTCLMYTCMHDYKSNVSYIFRVLL